MSFPVWASSSPSRGKRELMRRAAGSHDPAGRSMLAPLPDMVIWAGGGTLACGGLAARGLAAPAPSPAQPVGHFKLPSAAPTAEWSQERLPARRLPVATRKSAAEDRQQESAEPGSPGLGAEGEETGEEQLKALKRDAKQSKRGETEWLYTPWPPARDR